jgi:putative ABC transport system permease protein
MSRHAPLPLRLALRELRGGIAGFRVFIACIALGVAAIAGVTSVGRALTDGISSHGRVILGGDVAFSLIHRQATLDELAFLREAGRVGEIATMRAMVRAGDGRDQALVELKAVDSSYPHGGTLALADGDFLGAEHLGLRSGAFGALAAPELTDRLSISVGDRLRLGDATLQLRGIIRSEPDRLSSGIEFGPRLVISLPALDATGLDRPGSLVTWTYRIALPEGGTADAMQGVADLAQARFPDAGWRIRSRDNAAPAFSRNVEHFSQFLALIGLTALIAGGVGVSNAIVSYLDLKRPAIATLKCLGARSRVIAQVYLLQIVILAALGIVIGLLIGAAMPFVARLAIADLLPVAGWLYPRELAVAALYGGLVTLGFALAPLGRAAQLPASSLFADRAVAAPQRPPPRYRMAQAAALAGLAGLALTLSDEREMALLYLGAVAASCVVLRVLASAIIVGAARIGPIRGIALRLAVRNVHRPGALTTTVVLSLGLGLTLLVSLALIDHNLRAQLTGAMVEQAPDFFFLDIQQSERDPLIGLLGEVAQGGEIDTVPMLRGRFVAIDGVPTAEIEPTEDAAWALRGDRGVTYSDTVPENSKLAAGEWWPSDYDGEPLVSVEAGIAAGLGVRVGDTLTVNVLGRNLTARIANLRTVDWGSLSINFVLVFSPNGLAGAPHSILATLRLPDGAGRSAERAVLRAVTEEFPGVTSISVRDAIGQVNAIVADISTAVRLGAAVALIVSMLVLGGAIAAGQRQRRQDAVILKTLGATRRTLLGAYALEYGLLGAATAGFALAAGTASAWYVSTRVMELSFAPDGAVGVGAVLVALAITLGLGLAGTWRLLSAKPAPFLKNL